MVAVVVERRSTAVVLPNSDMYSAHASFIDSLKVEYALYGIFQEYWNLGRSQGSGPLLKPHSFCSWKQFCLQNIIKRESSPSRTRHDGTLNLRRL